MARLCLGKALRPTLAVALGVVLICSLGAGKNRPMAARARSVPRLPAAVLEPAGETAIEVLPIDPDRREGVQQAAAALDQLLAKRHAETGVQPGAKLTDEQFLRRVYLDLGGRIPTFDEAEAFLESTSTDKRDNLIEGLLESPDYVSRFYNVWAEVLRLQERPQRDLFFEPYLDWVKRSIAANRPYDQWVYEMLTADGKLWESPAVGYQLRDLGMPLPYVDNTVRVFLGTQIGCAQCHDHPFDSWTQHQFYELAAFTAGTQAGLGGKPSKEARKEAKNTPRRDGLETTRANVRQLTSQARKDAKQAGRPKVDQQFLQFLDANGTVVGYHALPLKLPHDYQYADAEPLAKVQPRVLWGAIPTAAQTAPGREQFAAWLTGRDNRQFARTIANRMWKLLMGAGVVEPIDDFRTENPPSHPELLEHLTDEMLRLDFDLREFVRLIVSTDTYQRRAVACDPTADGAPAFTAPALKRLSAEQLWDSILTLVAHDPWAYQRPTVEAFGAAVDLDLNRKKVSYEKAQEVYGNFQATFGRRAAAQEMSKQYGYRGAVLARASELPTPLPLGHFLRQFGQSDRETIDGGRTVATVPQILAMLNGPITHSMLQRGSVIFDEVSSHGPNEAVNVIFLSVLARRPSAADREFAMQEILSAENRAVGASNLIWALLNTREFLFIQ